MRLNLTNTGKFTRTDTVKIDTVKQFLDAVNGGAWPLVARGVICLLYCGNGRDS
jgi:hypothetical protein